jgi:glycosyltransferase involved in cell wall biosynthesis
MIRVISGWGLQGGSCVALNNLSEAFNEAGYECAFYSPHEYASKKYKHAIQHSGKLSLNSDDRLIFHFKIIPNRPPVKKVILSCHEKWWFKVGQIPQYWDTIQFLNEESKEYHKQNGYSGSSVIIPNIREKIILTKKQRVDDKKIAGIIGTIENRKQTHVSIQRALKDNCDLVCLFGHIGDQSYFNQFVKPLLSDKVKFVGYIEDKVQIYETIDCVYHSSLGEVASLTRDECMTVGIPFFGCDETNDKVLNLTNEQIINKWKEILEL